MKVGVTIASLDRTEHCPFDPRDFLRLNGQTPEAVAEPQASARGRFANGLIDTADRLRRRRFGQRAAVLQLPAGARAATAEGTVIEPQLRESSLST